MTVQHSDHLGLEEGRRLTISPVLSEEGRGMTGVRRDVRPIVRDQEDLQCCWLTVCTLPCNDVLSKKQSRLCRYKKQKA